MTDIEQTRIQEICKIAHIEDIGELSDGYHTFNQLYYQRMMLFATLVKQNRDKAWKSLRHSDGELCFGGGWFIVGIDTPEGSYTYHYEAEYFDLFDCEKLERGKVWDGHTEKDVTRLLSLEQEDCDDCISRKDAILQIQKHQICCYDSQECYPEQCEKNVISWLNDLPSVTPTSFKMEQIEQEPFINKLCVSSGVCEHDKNEVLDKIRAEIDRQEKWLLQAGYTAYNVDIAFDTIKTVLAESEVEE